MNENGKMRFIESILGMRGEKGVQENVGEGECNYHIL
jgi:hypothetical protein